MTDQLVMFDGAHFPRARRNDASSSHAAAAQVERNGTAKAQAERVLAAFRRYPMATTAELAKLAHIQRPVIARRAPELATANLLQRYNPTADTKPCEVSGIRCVRWCAK